MLTNLQRAVHSATQSAAPAPRQSVLRYLVRTYWGWTDEPTPYDCEVEGEELFVLNSGLGGNGQGSCLYDDAGWGPSGYTPKYGPTR